MEDTTKEKLDELKSQMFLNACYDETENHLLKGNLFLVHLKDGPFASENVVIGWTRDREYFVFDDGEETYLTKDIRIMKCCRGFEPGILKTTFCFELEYGRTIEIDIRKRMFRFWYHRVPYESDKIDNMGDVDDVRSGIAEYREIGLEAFKALKVKGELVVKGELSEVPKKEKKDVLVEKPWDYLLEYLKNVGRDSGVESDRVVGIRMRLVDDNDGSNNSIQYRIGYTPKGEIYVSRILLDERIKCKVFNYLRRVQVDNKDELIMYPKEIGKCDDVEYKGLIYIDKYRDGGELMRLGFGLLFELDNYEEVKFCRRYSFSIESIEFETV